MLQFARRGHNNATAPLTLGEVARGEGLTVAYVAKIVRPLRRAGLIRSVLGRSGGYTLNRDPRDITVLEVLNAMGERLYSNDYCSRFSGDKDACAHLGDCGIRSLWGVLEGLLDRVLGRTTLADLLGGESCVPGIVRAHAAAAEGGTAR